MNKINQFLEYLFNNIFTPFLNILCIIMLLSAFLNVISRYIFHYSIIWAPELSRFFYIFIIFIGTFLGIRKNTHIGLDILINSLSHQIQNIIEIIRNIILMIYFIFLIFLGFKFVGFGMHQMTLTLGIAKGWVYLVIPISAVLMFIAIFQSMFLLKFLNKDERENLYKERDL